MTSSTPSDLPRILDRTSIRRWMSGQPVANLAVFGPALLDLLARLPEIESTPPSRRHSVLLEMDAGVRLIVNKIQSRLMAAPSNGADGTELARLGSRMSRVMARGYARVADEFNASNNPVTRRKARGATLAMLAMLHQEQVCAALIYQPVSRGFWQMVNSHIDRIGHRQRKKNDEIWASSMKLLMFHLLDSRRLTRQQIRDTADSMSAWPLGSVLLERGSFSSPCFFLGQGDNPPAAGIPPSGFCRITHTEIQRYLTNEIAAGELSAAIPMRLIQLFVAKNDRTRPRGPDRGIAGTAGIASINKVLRDANQDGRTETGMLQEPTVVQWREAPLNTVILQLIDVSDEGCRFSTTGKHGNFSVGDPVMVEWRPGVHRIGTVCWMDRDNSNPDRMEYGMQWVLLAPAPVELDTGAHRFDAVIGSLVTNNAEAVMYATPAQSTPASCVVTASDGPPRNATTSLVRSNGALKVLQVEWSSLIPDDQILHVEDDIWNQLSGVSVA